MKKILYIPVLAMLAITILSSCSDFLEAENKSAGGVTAEKYFSTPEGLNSLRNNAFFSLRAVVTSNSIFENGTDLYWPSRGRGEDDFVRFSLAPENGDCQNLYVRAMEVANNANSLIHYGGEKYKADAVFLRSYAYYVLTQQFGPVPYSETYINDANRNYPRMALKDIYDNCIKALAEIYDTAPDKGATNDGTVNKRAIAALISKFNLAAAWDLETTLTNAEQGTYSVSGTAYATEAAAWAEKAISGINLSQSFEQKWSPFNEDKNPETFFSVQYQREGNPQTGTGHGLQNDFGSYYGDITTTFQKSVGSTKVPSLKSLYLWEEGDERYQGTFMTTFYNAPTGTWGTEGYFAYYNASEADKAKLPIAYYYAPYYVSQSDFEAFLTANASRFTEEPNKSYAYLMQNPVIAYTFSNGTWKRDNNNSGVYDNSTLQARLNFTPTVKKWDDPLTAQSNGSSVECYRDIVLLHASDLYLVAAEAYMLAGQEAQALQKINAVRSRAKAKTINALSEYDPAYTYTGQIRMIDLILDERARELYAESQRYIDLRRTRQLVKYNIAYNNFISSVNDMTGQDGNIKWYRPIPTLELNNNTSEQMNQNPGY